MTYGLTSNGFKAKTLEIIVDEITLPLDSTPPGRYLPTLGLYNFATGERLPTPDRPANEIPIRPIEIRWVYAEERNGPVQQRHASCLAAET